MQNLTQGQWTDQLATSENAVIIDVRALHEIAEGYIPGALHINIQDAAGFMQQTEALDKDKDYFLYCRSGGRSGQASMIMNSIGFKNTYNLMGGFDQWQGEKTI